MGRKIFVSYKYSDKLVQDLDVYEEEEDFWGTICRRKVQTTARHYVNEITELLENEEHIYKGENDDESMASLADSTIGSKLGDKIFDSTVTIVLVSKGMKDPYLPEKEQWIPWEISYSLKEQSRKDEKGNPQNSKTNGVIALVLPDENNSYEYYITRDDECNCRTLKTNFLFNILKNNMFNAKKPDKRDCNGSWVYSGDASYIQSIKWCDFIHAPTKYIDKAIELKNKKDDFELVKNIK